MGAERDCVSITNVIMSDEFNAIWREANQRCIGRDEYKDLQLPKGISPEEMHKIIEMLLCSAGLQLPFKPYIIMDDPAHVWISLTSEVRSLLGSIDRLASSSSETVHRLMGIDPFLRLPFMFDELVKISEMDGFPITRARASALWSGSAAAVTVEDQAFLALCDMFQGTDRYRDRKISRGFIEYIHETFEGGLKAAESLGPSQISALRGRTRQFTNIEYYDEEKTFSAIVTMLVDGSVPAVLRALQTQLFMLNLSPFEHFNHSTSLILHKVFYEQSDMPLLAFVPLTLAVESWNCGRSDAGVPDVEPLLTACRQEDEVGLDATPYEVASLRIIENELEKLKKRIDARIAHIDRTGEKIRASAGLNPRQKSTLLILLKHPRQVFVIKDYRNKHGISNSTARQDLLELVDEGYLSMSRKGGGETALISFAIGAKLLMLSYGQDVGARG